MVVFLKRIKNILLFVGFKVFVEACVETVRDVERGLVGTVLVESEPQKGGDFLAVISSSSLLYSPISSSTFARNTLGGGWLDLSYSCTSDVSFSSMLFVFLCRSSKNRFLSFPSPCTIEVPALPCIIILSTCFSQKVLLICNKIISN